ncbi:MAG: hypothetical protein KGR98_06990, partial [Verrucomicrobia bacterium]|nr:hypothetical protein [Verrucomicrobiota bacterium]
NINESIKQLTASLQELTARTYGHSSSCEAVAGKVRANELQVSKEVESFVAKTRAYADKTRKVSVGRY